MTDVDWIAPDPILQGFLSDAYRMSAQIFASSDLIEGEWQTPQHLLLHLSCHGLVRTSAGRIEEHDHFEFGIHLPSHYLSWVDPMSVLTVLSPVEMFHPNARAPVACIGPIEAGTLIDDLIYRVYDLVCFNNYTVVEQGALNSEACRWARNRMDLFPIDPRPLLWRHGDPVPPARDATARSNDSNHSNHWGSE